MIGHRSVTTVQESATAPAARLATRAAMTGSRRIVVKRSATTVDRMSMFPCPGRRAEAVRPAC